MSVNDQKDFVPEEEESQVETGQDQTPMPNGYLPSMNSGIFGSYYNNSYPYDPSMPNGYLPSMNSGIFGSYYDNSYVPSIYHPSMNNGVFGSYIHQLADSDEEKETLKSIEETKESETVQEPEIIPHYQYKPSKSISDTYRQVYQQYTSIKYDENQPIAPVDNNLKPIYDNMKKCTRSTGRTFIKVQTHNYNESGILNTIGLDINANTFNKNQFIRQYCNLYGLHASQINIVSVKSGSCIVEVYISNNEKYEVDLRRITQMVATDDRLNEKLREMKAFCLLFNAPTKKPGWENSQTFQEKVVFNSQYDRIYGPGNVIWTGNLQDGKDRGNKPYYCPVGWFKRAVAYKFFTANDFDNKFRGWPIAYHGTSFNFGLSMLLSGFIPSATGCFGGGVYVTPSIRYAAIPRYATPKQIPENSKQYLKQFGNGNWIQFVFQCRVKPSAIRTIREQTTGSEGGRQIDPNFNNNVLEWVIGNNTTLHDPTHPNCAVYIVGLMIRITQQHPKELQESQWWPQGLKNWGL